MRAWGALISRILISRRLFSGPNDLRGSTIFLSSRADEIARQDALAYREETNMW